MAAGETVVQTNQKVETHNSATVTVTTKTESTGILDGLRLNPWYFKSIPGIIKIIQLVIGVICMACGSPAKLDYVHFFLFVTVTCFLVTLLLCIAFLISLKNITPRLPWLTGEFVYTAVATLLYLIAAIVQLAKTAEFDNNYVYNPLRLAGYYGQYIAAGVFALFNTIAYGAGTYFLYQEWRSSRQPS